MTISRLIPLRRGSWTLSILFALSFLACSKKDRSDMVLMDIDLAEVPTTKSMSIALRDATTQNTLDTKTVATPALKGSLAKIALPQPAGLSASMVVMVTALAGDNSILGEGLSAPAPVKSGNNVGPIAIKVSKTVATPDGGAPDVSSPESTEAGTQPDDARKDAGADVTSVVKLDGQADLATESDSAQDAPFDAAPDSPSAKSDTPLLSPDGPPVAPDTAFDTGRDGPVGILSTMASCKRYLHFPDSAATCPPGNTSLNQVNVLVNTSLFTPDGKYLVTAGDNAWVKLWKVVDTGLQDTGLIFQADDFKVTAAVSPAGDTLAMANPAGDIGFYDLAAAEKSPGIVSKTATLLASKLATDPYGDRTRAFFTSDGKQLVAFYPTKGSGKGLVAVWDLATSTPIREFTHDYPSKPFAVANGPATGPLWVVMGKTNEVETDGGSYEQTTVTLLDVSASTSVQPSFVVPGQLYRAAFSADNLTLATGNYQGEVSLWDLSNKSNIQRFGSPLVEGVKANDTITALSYSQDGQFLVVGSVNDSEVASLRVITLKNRTVIQQQLPYPPEAFGFAPDGTTWAYGLGGCAFFSICK